MSVLDAIISRRNVRTFDGAFDKPLTREAAGVLVDALEAVRLAPSAVNKQPWRVVLSGNRAHFYENRSRGYNDGEWDIQKIDMGIALCHFEVAAKDTGKSAVLEISDPGIVSPADTVYIASFRCE